MYAQLKWIPAILMAFLVGGELFGQGQAPPPAEESPSTGWHRFGDAPQQGPPPPMELTLPSGTWITVRVDQLLSSDRNQQGDVFTGTLSQPLVANGLVIARRGQTVAGVVASAEKAGRVKGTSSLRLELTELSLVDGRQVQVKTTLMERRGNTSVGRGCRGHRDSHRCWRDDWSCRQLQLWLWCRHRRTSRSCGFHYWRSRYARPSHGGLS